MTLEEFLLDRIAEDEAEIALGPDFATLDTSGWMGHAAEWGRERALAECEAKRRIVDESGSGRGSWPDAIWRCLQFLALPYADHPDYREEWRP